MVKKAVMIAGICMFVLGLSGGCAESTGLETDSLAITKYKKVEIAQVEKPKEVEDKEVEEAISTNLQAAAEEVEVKDRKVQDGDTAYIDFTGKIDGVEFEGGSSQDYPLLIGSKSFIEGFEESIIGHSVNDTFDWNGKFPDDYGNADYAGKNVVFTITVKKITEQKVPELTDEYVKGVSKKSKTVDEYKAEMRENLKKERELAYQNEIKNKVWEEIMKNTTIEKYDEEEVAKVTDAINEQYSSMAEMNGVDLKTFIEQSTQGTLEDFQKQVDEAAKENAKQVMIMQAIAEKENIKVSEEEYKKELERIVDMYGYDDVDALKAVASEEELRRSVEFEKVREWLAEKCVQVAE